LLTGNILRTTKKTTYLMRKIFAGVSGTIF
jgi:hypothetical protein